MSTQYESIPLELPSEIVEASPGFALDIGYSTARITYRSKEDYDNGTPIKDELKAGKGRVHLVSGIPATNIDDVIELIRTKCDRKRADGEIEVASTGSGCRLHRQQLEKGLHIRLKLLSKWSCNVAAFRQMASLLPKDELFAPVSEKAAAESKEQLEMIMGFVKDKAFEEWGFDTSHIPDAPQEAESQPDEPVFPCVLAVCGSTTRFIKIEEDGKWTSLNSATKFNGRMICGLSNMLIGKNDFASICLGVESGSSRTIDEYPSDLVSENPQEDAYDLMGKFEHPAMPFGKAVTRNRDQIQDDDMLHSMYRVACITTLDDARFASILAGVQNVYFCGYLFDTQAARDWMAVTQTIMNHMVLQQERKLKLEFVNHGSHLGSLGAFLEAGEVREC